MRLSKMAVRRDFLIDVTRLTGRMMARNTPTGIDRVCQRYIEHYGPASQAVLYAGRWRVIYSPSASRKIFDAIVKWERLSGVYLYSLYLKDRFGLYFARPRGKIFFNICHSGIEHDWYVNDLKKAGVIPVFMIHDLIPILHPDFVRDGETERHTARVRNILSIAGAVITNSAQTLMELRNYAGHQNVPMPPALSSLLGTQSFLPVATSEKTVRKPYFLMVGTIEGRKNHAMILRVWKSLVKTLGQNAPGLILIGNRGWKCDEAINLLDKDKEISRYVREVGACDDKELASWLRSAQALLFPSYAEGYGMPLSEALSQNLPVIASDLQVFREVAGNVPDYLPPDDEAMWLNAIIDYLGKNGSPRRQKQLERLASYDAPSWEAHFKTVDGFIKTIPKTAYALGISWRKQKIIRNFMPARTLEFVRRISDIPEGADVVVWGNPALPQGKKKLGTVIHIEDGFVRSVGLGAALTAPQSLVIDPIGIYYDARRPSLLEKIIAETDFSEELLRRAEHLRLLIIDRQVTKYNLGGSTNWQAPAKPQKIILVPGQVESDASIRDGSPVIKNNITLLKTVREKHPDAYIVYKPHPDVVAGLRLKGKGEEDAGQYADVILTDIAIQNLLPIVDEVHTLTSLTGFEALIRNIRVTCYGQPFYAGWGLTTDIYPIERRIKRIKLDELVAATLILYPAYKNGAPPEKIIEELSLRAKDAPDKVGFINMLYNGVVKKILKTMAY